MAYIRRICAYREDVKPLLFAWIHTVSRSDDARGPGQVLAELVLGCIFRIAELPYHLAEDAGPG